jgi:hypothetical protein
MAAPESAHILAKFKTVSCALANRAGGKMGRPTLMRTALLGGPVADDRFYDSSQKDKTDAGPVLFAIDLIQRESPSSLKEESDPFRIPPRAPAPTAEVNFTTEDAVVSIKDENSRKI